MNQPPESRDLTTQPAKPPAAPARRSAMISRADYAEFLPDIQAVAEQRHSPLARILILLVAVICFVVVGWSHFAKVDQVATAPGVVRPVGKSKIINHPVGGRVAEIMVAEGDVVETGQPLLRLDPEFLAEEVAGLTSQWQELSMEVARLDAEVNGGDIVLPGDIAAARPDLREAQIKLLAARRTALDRRRQTADKVIERRGSEATTLQRSIKRLRGSLAVLEDQARGIEELVQKGYYPAIRYQSIERQVIDQVGQIAETQAQLRAAYSALEEAKSERAGIDDEARAQMLDELESRRRERDAALSQLQQNKARLRNLLVASPVDGIVQELEVTTPGQAVRPNEPIMKIVPTGGGLVIVAKVSNDDIGYIGIGQKATIKVRTYDFIRYGSLSGVVDQVAADAIQDDQTGEFLFDVSVRTDRDFLGDNPGEQPVQPGMLADVDLHIGERSILSYLTDRVLRTTEDAFRER